MKTDRELLELAAKAAGINGYFVNQHIADADCGILTELNEPDGRHIGWRVWNPLEHNGDALRLLHSIYRKSKVDDWIRVYDNLWAGTLADTRRAIVRAAASLSLHAETKE